MRVLVSDTSVLIDLERSQLIEPAFRLPWEFAVPDLLYKQELKGSFGDQLIKLGMRVEALDGDGLSQALAHRARVKALTLPDAMALALAQRHDWQLLTGDGPLRTLAGEEGMTPHGVLWLFDRIHVSIR